MCFAVNNRESLKNVEYKWNPEVRHHKRQAKVILTCKLTSLCLTFTRFDRRLTSSGTKIDLRDEEEDCVETEEGEAMAKKIKADEYVECSSKKMLNVRKVFANAITVHLMPKNQKKRPMTMSCAVL